MTVKNDHNYDDMIRKRKKMKIIKINNKQHYLSS